MLKFTLFIAAFFCFQSCEQSNVDTTSNRACDRQQLKKEFSYFINAPKCNGLINKTGDVVLVFRLDERGVPKEIRPSLASLKIPQNVDCAINGFQRFRSKTQTNCDGDISVHFVKQESELEIQLRTLRSAIETHQEAENLDTFSDFYDLQKMTLGYDELDILAAFALFFLEHPERGKADPLVRHFQHDFHDIQPRNAQGLNITDKQLHTLQLAHMNLIANDLKKLTFQQKNDLDRAKVLLSLMQKEYDILFREDELFSKNAIYLMASSYFQLSKIASERKLEWLEYSNRALDVIRFSSYHRTPDTKLKVLINAILKQRRKGCPSKKQMFQIVSTMKNHQLAPDTVSLKWLTAMQKRLDIPAKTTLNEDRRFETWQFLHTFQKSTCWVSIWDKDFFQPIKTRQDNLTKIVHAYGLEQCIHWDTLKHNFELAFIIDPKGHLGHLKFKNISDPKIKKCIRRKLYRIKWPTAKNVQTLIPISIDFHDPSRRRRRRK